MIDELKELATIGDPASPAALDLGRRWKAHTAAVTSAGEDVAGRMRSMVRDALADPVTAPQMPFSAQDLEFLEQIFGKLKETAA